MKILFIDQKNNAFGYYEKRLRWIKKSTSSKKYNIYIAKIRNKIPSQNAYFIEYEKNQMGYLRSKKALHVGDEILVEYVDEKKGDKKPRFRLGCSLFLFPFYWETPYKIEEGHIKEFKNNLSKERYKKRYEQLQMNIQYLARQQKFLPIPRLLMKQDKTIEKILYDYKIEKIVTNDKAFAKKYESYIDTVYKKDYDYRYDELLTKDLLLMKQRTIILESGASIVFDQTEAMMVVDINSTSSKSSSTQINQEAIKEIYAQLILREISGIVIIDLINDQDHRELLDCIYQLQKDTIYKKIKYHDITALNLLELTISG